MITVDDNFRDKYVCVLGLGYVGLTLALAMADVGYHVIGVEIRDDVLKSLKKGKAHFYEPGLEDLLARLVKAKRIRFVKHIPNGVKASVYIITVGTPLNQQGKVRLDMIESVAKEVSAHLKKDDMVILRSTVKIGTTSNNIYPILKKSGVYFDLAFCPERTLEGQALKELRLLPQIIGGRTVHAAVRAGQLFQFLTPTVVRVNDIETAEMIKLIDNAHRDVFFSFSNEVARLCDKVGISAMEVIQAGKLGYPRTNLPMPGLVGGPCLVKDPYILAEGTRERGITPEITLLARRLNEKQPEEVVSFLSSYTRKLKGFPKRPRIALMGIAFKGRPATDDLRGTMALPVFNSLKRHFAGAEFVGYDPVVSSSEIKKFGLKPISTLEGALQGSNLVLILNNHPVFSSMNIQILSEKMKKPGLIYDFWNSFTGTALDLAAGVSYMALGSHGRVARQKNGSR